MGITEWVASLWQTEESPSEYFCQRCESQFQVQYYQCPNCGCFCIERVDWESVIDE